MDHEDPDLAPLHHAVEVAGPGLVDAGVHAQPFAELRLRGRREECRRGEEGERHGENPGAGQAGLHGVPVYDSDGEAAACDDVS